MPSFRDLTGRRFARIRVVSLARCDPGSYWHCKCDCGAEKIIAGKSLVQGLILSCGCLKKERCAQINAKHRQYLSKTYKIWVAMKQRCENPKSTNYANYGARGIKVCEEWRSDFRHFIRDMGEAPARLTLERIDNDGDYCKANCRWATRREQNINKRSTVFVTVNGQKIPLITAAEKAGITWNCADKRIKRGWTVERTFGIPISQ